MDSMISLGGAAALNGNVGNISNITCQQLINETFQNGINAGYVIFVIGIIIGAGFVAVLWYLSKKKTPGSS